MEKLQAFGRRPVVRYAASLPERVLRSASALSAGVVREFAEVALPIGVRRGRLYRNLVDATLRYLIEHVGQVEGVYSAEQALAEDFLARRAVGNGIEVMGVLAFRASPVWVLAALADICGAGRQLIPQIAESLKSEGLLEPEHSFTTVEQLLEGLERTTAQLAETVNTPPLDVAGLRREWETLLREARQLPAPTLPKPADVTRLWSDLRDSAARENRSVFEVSSLLAVSAVGRLPERARVLSRSAAVAVSESGGMFSRALLDHYRSTLREIGTAGFIEYGSRQLSPYAQAAVRMFAPQRETITESFVGARSARTRDEDESGP